jgi:hypothetical protein
MHFLENSISRLRSYKALGEGAMAQLADTALLKPGNNENDNSIVVLVKHMSGNMLSRWTAFLTEDGEKPWRQRDDEFVHEELTRAELMKRWEQGWRCLLDALASLKEEDLSKTVHIRNEGLSAMDAIIRQLMHYSYHVGQIVLLCKEAMGSDWKSLSVPRGGTAAYNAGMGMVR